MEAHVVHVEAVRGTGGVLDFADLGVADAHHLVDPLHVHLEVVDVATAEPEPANSLRPIPVGPLRMAHERRGPRCRAAELLGGADLQQVQGVVGAAESTFEGVRAQVRLEAAQHRSLCRLEADEDLGAVPDRQWIRVIGSGDSSRPPSVAIRSNRRSSAKPMLKIRAVDALRSRRRTSL